MSEPQPIMRVKQKAHQEFDRTAAVLHLNGQFYHRSRRSATQIRGPVTVTVSPTSGRYLVPDLCPKRSATGQGASPGKAVHKGAEDTQQTGRAFPGPKPKEKFAGSSENGFSFKQNHNHAVHINGFGWQVAGKKDQGGEIGRAQ